MHTQGKIFKVSNWITIALINFCIVALAGVTLRYKINFRLSFVNQKYLLEAHSYFAFSGWVTLALMALMVHYLQRKLPEIRLKTYRLLLWSSCLLSYGLFVTFFFQGYDVLSIGFCSINIFVSYMFIACCWHDLNKIKDHSLASKWLRTALLIWALSSLGALALAYLMYNNIMIPDFYFGAVYFFLHFQYNGWFLFACFALLFSQLHLINNKMAALRSRQLFYVMACTVVPTFVLSILWLKLPLWLRWVGNISGVLQLLVLFCFVSLIPVLRKALLFKLSRVTRWLWSLSAIAFLLKIVLQLFSIIPYFSQYAFGYRPVVIGYLHLSFLGIISFFLLGYMDLVLKQYGRKLPGAGVLVFVSGVILQELILMVQGLEALEVQPLRSAPVLLFYCAIIIAAGLLWILAGACRKNTAILTASQSESDHPHSFGK